MRMVPWVEGGKSPYTPSIRPYTSEYTAVYSEVYGKNTSPILRVYGRILRSIRQEYFSNTSSILPNTSKSVDCHTQVWVYGIGILVFLPSPPPYFEGAKLIFSYPMGTRND